MDASNATITNLDVSAASIRSLDASNATITVLDVSAAKIRQLDASSADITNLDVSSASISSLNVSNATITILDVSAASIRSLDASNATITYLDVSAAIFNHLDASSASVSGRFNAGYAYVGDKFQPDPSQNFVFINAVAGQTVANVRGSNLPNGSLQLGANSTCVNNIILESSGVTVNAPSNPAITVSDISLNIFKPGTSNPEIRVDVSGTTIYTPLPPPIFSSVGGAPYMYYSSIGPTNSTSYNSITQPTLPSGVYYIMGVCADSNNSEAKISTTAFYANGGVYNGWFAGGSALGPPLDSDTTYPGAQLKLRAKRDRTGLECIVLNAGSPAVINVQFIFIATYLFYPNPF